MGHFIIRKFLSGVEAGNRLNRLASSPTLSRKLAAELFGTFIFVLVGAGSAVGAASLGGANSGTLLLIAAFGNGLGLAVAVSVTMSISGGVLNPAVAVGLWVGKKLKAKQVLYYIVAEIIGATAAGAALVVSFPSALGSKVQWGATTLGNGVSYWQGAAIEALLTFVLMMAIYGTAVDSRAPKIGGLGIGLAVLTDVLVGGNLTGASMNPARSFGPMIAGGFIPGYWYVYIIGPLIGAVSASLVYSRLIENPE
jgi:MIP family channel proteins